MNSVSIRLFVLSLILLVCNLPSTPFLSENDIDTVRTDWSHAREKTEDTFEWLYDQHLETLQTLKRQAQQNPLWQNTTFSKTFEALMVYLEETNQKERRRALKPRFGSEKTQYGGYYGIPQWYQSYLSPPEVEYDYRLWVEKTKSLKYYISQTENYDILYFTSPPPSLVIEALQHFINEHPIHGSEQNFSKLITERIAKNYYEFLKTQVSTNQKLRNPASVPESWTEQLKCSLNQPCFVKKGHIQKVEHIVENSPSSPCTEPKDFRLTTSLNGIIVNSPECTETYKITSQQQARPPAIHWEKASTYNGPLFLRNQINDDLQPYHYLYSDQVQLDIERLEKSFRSLKELIGWLQQASFSHILHEINQSNQEMATSNHFWHQSVVPSFSKLATPLAQNLKLLAQQSKGFDQLRGLASHYKSTSRPGPAYLEDLLSLHQTGQLSKPKATSLQLFDKIKSFSKEINLYSWCLYPGWEWQCPFDKVSNLFIEYDKVWQQVMTDLGATHLNWKNISIFQNDLPYIHRSAEQVIENRFQWRAKR